MGSKGVAKAAVRKFFFGVLVIATIVCLGVSDIHADEQVADYAIVWCADVSSSMADADEHRFWTDAVALGVDLAPARTEAAFLAINDQVVTKVGFLMVDEENQRSVIKKAAENTTYSGYTNFNAGLEVSLEMLEKSRAREKHLFLVADICESGFSLPSGDYSFVVDEMTQLTQMLVDAGVRVHLLFMGYSRENLAFMTLWDTLVHRTGGSVTYVSPNRLTNAVEELYFSKFAYGKTVIDVISIVDDEWAYPVFLPRFALERARFFINMSLPGVQTENGDLSAIYEQNRSYTLLELEQPFPEKVELTIPSGRYGGIPLYLLTDSNIKLDVTSTSIVEENEQNEGKGNNQQKTTVTLSVVASEQEFPQNSMTSGAGWHVVVTDPAGVRVNVEQVVSVDNSYIFDLYPEIFGEYGFALTMDSHGVQITANTTAEIARFESPIIIKEYSLSILAATVIGFLIILAAVLYTRHKRRQEGEPALGMPDLADMSSQSLLHGRLDIYGIIVEGGKADIPPIHFHIKNLTDRRLVKLSTVLEQSGIPYYYRAADDIHLLPGTDNLMVIKNLSNAVVYSGGRPYYRGQQAAIAYGQKIRVVFEEDTNEYEIYYHNSVEMVNEHVRMN